MSTHFLAWLLGLLALTLTLAACGESTPPAQSATQPRELVDPYTSCWAPGADPDCSSSVEERLIQLTGGSVERRGDTLWIYSSEAGPIPFVNESGEGGRYIRFIYNGSADEIGAHIVRVNFYEGGTFSLVDRRTGNQTDVYSAPLVAPSGQRFATAALDLVAGYGPNGIQVWMVTPDGPRLEWTLSGGESWGADGVVWLSDDVLEFTRHVVVPGLPEPDRIRTRLTLGRNRMSLEPAEDPGR